MSAFSGELHATGSLAGRRQSLHEAKGRNESRERRVAWEPHVDLRSERSWEVKKAREVLRLLWDMVRFLGAQLDNLILFRSMWNTRVMIRRKWLVLSSVIKVVG